MADRPDIDVLEIRDVLEDSECDCHDSHLAALDRLAARLSEAEEALDLTERDARWIVAQWARLQDKPVEEVALAIVARIVAARAHLEA